jgi:RNA polymerase sigma factor (sigma-70 family)
MGAADIQLLRKYREGSHDAFRELVRRHVNMVFSAARRQSCSHTQAEEIAQSVFIQLARDAGKISSNAPIAAWLHLVTRHTAINFARAESRRQAREQSAVEISAMNSGPSDWERIEPLLDEAVASLSPADRCAIVLRFFEGKSLREVGEALGSTEEAARKRISRALDNLRVMFLRRGVAVSSGALAADFAAYSTQAAPTGLSAAILSGVATSIAGLPPAIVGNATIFAMSTIHKSLLAAIVILTGSVVFYQARKISRQDADLAQLQKRYDTLVRGRGTTPPVARGAGVVSFQTRGTAGDDLANPADRALVTAMSDWVERASRLRDSLRASSMWVIPEYRLLREADWLDVARDADLSTDAKAREAFDRLRDAANRRVAAALRSGLKAYASANGGMMPPSADALMPYVDSSVDPESQLSRLSGASLDHQTKQYILSRVLESDRFEKVMTRSAPAVTMSVGAGAREPAAVANESKLPTVIDSLAAFNQALVVFKRTNSGQMPANEAQLVPLLPSPVSPAMVRLLLEAARID